MPHIYPVDPATILVLLLSSVFMIAVMAFLPSKQSSLQPVRVRRDDVRHDTRRNQRR